MDRSRLMHTYQEPSITFVSGSGTKLVDTKGKEYLDFLAGIAVVSLGHAHPEVAAVLNKQSNTLLHVSNLFGNDVGPEVASTVDELISQAQGRHGRVFFANSGAEANECALKLARKAHPDRHVVLSFLDSFHGRTLATLAATGQAAKQAAFQPLPEGFENLAFGDIEALESRLAVGDVAAVLVECIQAEGGVNVPAPGYLSAVQAACRAQGALFMVDEVQTGLGRTGTWFSFEDESLQPDVVTLAKSLGNGVPVGACWAAEEVADCYVPGDHGSTFGGQPLAMSAALTTLRCMKALHVPKLAQQAGARIVERLSGHPCIDEIRGRGLLLGIALKTPTAQSVVAECLTRGLVLNAVTTNTIRITPPLTVSEAEIDQALSILIEVLDGGQSA